LIQDQIYCNQNNKEFNLTKKIAGLFYFFFFSNGQHVFLGGEKEKREERKNSLPAPLYTPPVNTRLITVTGVRRRIE